MSEDHHELERPGLQRFGSVIRARRRQLALTQQQLAHRAGTSVPYIGYLETERRHPSEKMVMRLAEVLRLDPRELFFLANPGTQRLISRDQESDRATSWEVFRNDDTLRKIHNISEQEMRVLSGVARLGEVRNPRDFLLILNTIRHVLG
jgi:transcriptional regulator with XRE-family HTH domain